MSFRKKLSPRPRTANRRSFRLFLEQLEDRRVLASVVGVEPNDTIATAQALGDVTGHSDDISGVVGNGANTAADVDFYEFTLSQATNLQLQINNSNFNSVITLYNTDTGNTFDPSVALTGHRLLEQAVNSSGVTTLLRTLGAGTYYVAVSGEGNRYFYPQLEASGRAGSTGAYQLDLQATANNNNSQFVLATDFDDVTTFDVNNFPVLDSSPLVLHYATRGTIDPNSDVQLYDIDYNPVPFEYEIRTGVPEMQVKPIAAFAPDTYQLFAYDTNGNLIIESYFTVGGVSGNVNGFSLDTVSHARDLGALSGLTQVAGAIGNNPSYTPLDVNGNSVLDPHIADRSNQIDIYRFEITGASGQQFNVTADAFAARIGSSLNTAMTLFRVDNGTPIAIAGNNDTTQTVSAPLDTDSSLAVTLTPGEYFIAIGSGENLANPAIGGNFGLNNVFDPLQPQSGSAGDGTIGDYVFSLQSTPVPTVSLTLVGSPIAENAGTATVRATLSNSSSQTVTVNLGFTGTATNNQDYSRSNVQIVIGAGQTSGSITLTAIDDVDFENNETVIVDITSVTGGMESGTQQVTATISDNDVFTQPTARVLHIASTSGNNTLLLLFVSGNQFLARLDGITQVFNKADYDQIEFDGAGGNDLIQINGLPGVATIGLSSGGVNVDTAGLDISLTNIETAYVFGTAADTANFQDTTGNDVFYGASSFSILAGSGRVLEVIGVGTVNVTSTAGSDVALFFDAGSNDTVQLGLTQTTQTTGSSTVTATNFASVYAFAISSGSDTATFVDSTGDDTFYSLAGYAAWVSSGYFVEAIGHESMIANSTAGGSDTALLFDSSGNDTLNMSPAQATMTGGGINVQVNQFERVYAFSSTGNDTATIVDSAGDDRLWAYYGYAVLVGAGFQNQATNFDTVQASASSGGYDTAYLYDGPGDDTFEASGNFAELQYDNGHNNRASAFDAVYTFGTSGGKTTRNVSDPLAYALAFEGM